MISCKLYGGLGNQMFQIAATIATALKYNSPYCIPKHTLNDKIWKPYHFENILYGDVSAFKAQVWHEPSHAYTEIPDPKDNVMLLDGYFQSYRYFEDYLPEIISAFGFDNIKLPLTTLPITSIHVRRGDYLKYPDKHPVVTEDYLRRAIAKMGMIKPHHNKIFLIFSDDMPWCDKFFNPENFPGCMFLFSENNSDLNDLIAMAACQHNIISNSTFGYWGAMLNSNPAKIVIAPHHQNWFGEGNKHLPTHDILPPNWFTIKY